MMRSLIVSCVALLALGVAVAPALAQEETKEPSFEEQFTKQLDEWLPGMGADKIPERGGPQQALQNKIFSLGGPGHEEELKTACTVIATKLGPETAQPARIWLLRVLEFNGGPECVEAVAKCLDDGDATVREAARRCLANNPAPEANQKLLDALGKARDGRAKATLANALGYRADAKSVSALAGLLGERDEAVVTAAANALGKIADDAATRALAGAVKKVPEKLKAPVADAYLRCADKLLSENKRNEAKAIYQQMAGADMPKATRLAAMQGMLKVTGGK
jgi:hypothetical protein